MAGPGTIVKGTQKGFADGQKVRHDTKAGVKDDATFGAGATGRTDFLSLPWLYSSEIGRGKYRFGGEAK